MKRSLTKDESGAALVTALLVLMLASGLMAGMFAALLASQRSHATDRDQSVAYAAAHAGLEKLTTGLAQLFVTDFSPSAAQLAIVDNTPPAIAGFQYTSPGGVAGSGYEISFTPDPGPGPNTGNPLALQDIDITTGPFEGLKGLITPYILTVTARSLTGNSEVRLRRELQTVAVPVFQFGIFGEKALGFHAGPNFDFGGRVHTNQSLYIASGTGNTLTFRDKITAFTQVVRNTLSNGIGIGLTGHGGNVSIPTVIGGAPATYRNLASTESSGTIATPCVGAATNNSNCWTGWKNMSEVTYATNIRTEATGAKQLNLPLTSQGATPIDLIRRPPLGNENVANAAVFGQRYFAQASLRILLSDRAADLTNLPTITGGAPLQLDAAGGPAGYVVAVPAGVPASGRPPIARSPANEPIYAVDGTSLTRVSAINAGAQTLTIATQAAPPGGLWVANVAPWLKPTTTVGGVAFTCTTLLAAQLSGCGAHVLYNIGTIITFTRADGATTTATLTAQALANSAIINLPAGFSSAQRFTASSSFFVREHPVTCTGYNATQLTGCTLPNNVVLNAVAPAGLAVNDPVYSGSTTPLNTPLLNGFIKIEKQNAAGVWSDVTLEILNLGIAGTNQTGALCQDPTPNAVLRFQRLRDNGLSGVAPSQCNVAGGVNNYFASINAADFVPLTLFDAREGWSRPIAVNSGMNVGGLFGYVALDANNFRRWVAGAIGVTGNQAWNNNGYIIYFSDRRGDHDETAADIETGEYGNEDSINPALAAWAKTNALDVGENFNESRVDPNDPASPETLQMYGESPHPLAVPAGPVANMGFDAASRPWTSIPLLYSGRGRLARPVLFRRALKIINAGMGSLPATGFTVTSENPIYVQGNFNATAASVVAEPNVATAIIADSVTLLSTNFNDAMTFQFPNDAANRPAITTGYRFAMVTGKTIPFPKPGAWGVNEMGSDGGVHNFMKMLENWGGQTLRYRGSMVSLYYSRQAIGIYRADANIYSPPTRAFNFDTDFLTPALLPPGTPMFRDINTLKFRQILRPNQ